MGIKFPYRDFIFNYYYFKSKLKKKKKTEIFFFLCILFLQQLGGASVSMQPNQVPTNQNFLNRPPGPIPVSHGNVQQQVNKAAPFLLLAAACGGACLTGNCLCSFLVGSASSLWWWACPPLVRSPLWRSSKGPAAW